MILSSLKIELQLVFTFFSLILTIMEMFTLKKKYSNFCCLYDNLICS